MTNQFDAIIIGGGVVGLAAALGLAQREKTIALIDSQALEVNNNKVNHRVYAINRASQQLLTRLGCWPLLDEKRLSPFQGIYVWDDANGAHIDFDARLIAQNNLGHIVEEPNLKAALLLALQRYSTVTLLPDTAVTDVLSLPDGMAVSNEYACWRAHYLIIADGAHSPCRRLLQIPLNTQSYEQHAIVATVQCEQNHQRIARQVFHADGPLAFLPLVDPYYCSIVWSISPSRAEALMALTPESFNEQLTQAFSSKLGHASLVSPRYQFPLVMQHTQHYYGQRWVLLGDAAHTIHPLAGLGLNLGLTDVSAWLQCVDQSVAPFPPNKYLAAFQRARKYEVSQTIWLMQAFKSLFASQLPPVQWLRAMGLKMCQHLPLLKRLFIAHAEG